MSIQAEKLYQDLLHNLSPVVLKHFLEQAEKDFKRTDDYELDYDKIAEIVHKSAKAIYKKNAEKSQR
jgi:hypothetical protein